MKLSFPEVAEPFFFTKEAKIHELIVENKAVYAQIVRSLVGQLRDGGEGDISLYNENKAELLDFGKNVYAIIDPFSVDVNIRSVVNSLNKQVLEIAMDEDNYIFSRELEGQLLNFAQRLLEKTPDGIEILYNVELANIIKALDLHIQLSYEDMPDSLLDTMCVLSDYGKLKLFIFSGLRTYMPDEDFAEFVKMANYKGLYALFLEGTCGEAIDGVCRRIVDEDLCEIK